MLRVGERAAAGMTGGDRLLPFVFDNAAIRGAWVSLDATWQAVLQRHDYPAELRPLLGEAMAASALLCGSLKFAGTMLLQLRGNGPLRLLVVECNADLTMRATAKWTGSLDRLDLRSLLGDGQFVITLDPGQGQQPYQGIVAGEGGRLSSMLEHYLATSEQVESRLWLVADGERARGLLLQRLPAAMGRDEEEDWQRVQLLAATLRPAELLGEDALVLLRRLFNEDTLRGFSPRFTCFRCSCSRRRVGGMLRMLGREEVDGIVAEQGRVEVQCEFCNQRYEYDAVDATALFVGDDPLQAVTTRQ